MFKDHQGSLTHKIYYNYQHNLLDIVLDIN
jgi:hypothetical protein